VTWYIRLSSGLVSVTGGGGSLEMGMYMSSREGWIEPGWRGLRRERRKHGLFVVVMVLGLMGFVEWAISAHDTRNMFAEYASAMR
jgi:ABC-type phosphate/phosphonate transport system permease subunit